MSKVALIIIYNHQYNQNVDKLEKIYKDRFSNIYHLMPFYNGDKNNVIPVYENSFYFQGYVSQGFKSYFKKEYVHYFFVGDDLILNPIINENNYFEHLKLNSNTCFIPDFITLHDRNRWWKRTGDAFRWDIKLKGIEAANQLPDYEEALQRFHKINLKIKPLHFNQIWNTPKNSNEFVKKLFGDRHYLKNFLRSKYKERMYSLRYPIVGSYSDIFVVSSDAIKQFSHYCGVFAATKLFVELALPTSLVLAAKEIVTEKELKLKGKALWTKEDYQELDKYGYSFDRLISEFPKNYIYLHPIKLSKWNTELSKNT